MAASSEGVSSKPADWTIQSAEELLGSLPGVISVRVVGRPGGRIDEVHLLTTEEATPKQTVRNVESALKAHYHLEIDHRTISVARTSEPVKPEPKPAPPPDPTVPFLLEDSPRLDTRILFVRHQVETERSHRVKAAVTVEWGGSEFQGQETGADLPRARLETLARATLRAIEDLLNGDHDGSFGSGVSLTLDGVKIVDAFDANYVLVAVNAIQGREIAGLAGASAVEDTLDRAVILATLQATDRWARGRL